MVNITISRVNMHDSLPGVRTIMYNEPLSYIDELEHKKHIVLFYHDIKEGQKIQYRFIKNGLLKGENCIYTTHGNDIPLIENEMRANEIDVDEFYNKELLYIHKIPNLFEHPEGVIIAAQNFIKKIFCGLRPPFRVVGRVIDKLVTKEQVEANLTLERIFHSEFDDFDGIVMCHYNVNESPSNTEGKWISNILRNHHSAICLVDSGQGVAFDMK